LASSNAYDIVTVEHTTPTAAAPAMLGPRRRAASGSGSYKWYVLGVLVLIYIHGNSRSGRALRHCGAAEVAISLSDKQIGALNGQAIGSTASAYVTE